NIPTEFKGKFEDWMFGCDICQDVCPWNRFSKPHNEPLFNPHPELLSMTRKDWEEITEDTFNKVFQKSAVKRTKFSGLKRNINFYNDETVSLSIITFVNSEIFWRNNISIENMWKQSQRRDALIYHDKPTPGNIEDISTKKYASHEEMSLSHSTGVGKPCI